MLAGVDLAAFAVALVARLRDGGVVVPADGPAVFVAALALTRPGGRTELYWITRLALVNRAEDLAAFDATFAAVFDDAVLAVDPVARGSASGRADAAQRADDAASNDPDAATVGWVTLSTTTGRPDQFEPTAPPIGLLPSRLAGRADEPFADFDPADLRLLGSWLEHAAANWPRRRTRRREPHPHGTLVDLRATMRASRTTGWEPVRLTRTRPRRRPRRIVLVCDVSRSMQPYAAMYLHLMRAAVARPGADRAEVFAFATTLTRLTAVLSHRSADVALARANARVVDRYGGTHIGSSLTELFASPHGNALRGAIVLIASDGWDTDDPAVLAKAMNRIRGRAHRVVWLNPRASEPAFEPRTRSMTAALPFCDALLPAHSLTAVRDLLGEAGPFG
ncbi:VWA domain-containing protein [Aldersonia sp. NBC_00410]|uniref:vWA domain-containing protein n=1 Tax=Aldersonia sp. NBC_00410 TaxID=2975954 RepID=UPI002256FFEA|nr:VWA domain-containing protein [Aldersonia sp. NBC_00410]MCX5042821.1 VWA domain-containing protein [Aldersonia sp. NBC_00410]